MQLDKLLQLGFSENEAIVYLMLLRIGPSPASSIATRLGMNRVTVYAILNSLCHRGLASYQEGKQKKNFIPHDPECLLYLVEKEQSKLKFRIKLAKECIENLQNVGIHTDTTYQKIAFYTGASSIIRFLNEKVSKCQKLYSIFLSFNKNTMASKKLEAFLLNFINLSEENCIISVLNEQVNSAKLVFNRNVKGLAINPNLNGDLLIQENSVIFIYNNNNEMELMYLNDPQYASFVKELTFA